VLFFVLSDLTENVGYKLVRIEVVVHIGTKCENTLSRTFNKQNLEYADCIRLSKDRVLKSIICRCDKNLEYAFRSNLYHE
jgi:hypothetical protein